MKGFWMGYFAARAAPMGPVAPAVVEAVFYNFASRRVRRALPDAWDHATPDRLLEARCHGSVATLHAVLDVDAGQLRRAVELAAGAVEQLELAGRPLAAANAALALGDDPWAALWQSCTTLREHRGDGHVAALVDAELDGCEAHVTVAATGTVPREVLQPARGFTDEEWEAAVDRLRHRGVLNEDGALTDDGAQCRRAVEAATDRLARGPWHRIGPERTEELHRLLEPMALALASSGVLPLVNPIGVSPGDHGTASSV
jgi:hypothetical protein